MAETKTTSAAAKHEHEVPEIKASEVKQKIKVVDLETGAEDAETTIVYNRYSVPDYDEKKHGSKTSFLEHLMAAARKLVAPEEKQIDALLYRATQESYQSGKVSAYSGGKYLSPELKTAIVNVVKNSPKFADSTTSEAFAAWKSAFTSAGTVDGKTLTGDQVKSRKGGADKVLATAQAMLEGADLL